VDGSGARSGVAAREARSSGAEAPLAVAGSAVALDGDCLPRQVGEGPSGSCFEACDGIREGYVDVAEADLATVTDGVHARAPCHGVVVAENTERLLVEEVGAQDRIREAARSSRCSSCSVPVVYAPVLPRLWVARELLQVR
jgi:hypothetical protein